MIDRPAKSATRQDGRDTPPAEEEIDEVSEYGALTLIHGGRSRNGERRRTREENT